MTRQELLKFYKETNYSPIRLGNPSRPSEWHLPIQLSQLKESDIKDNLVGKEISFELSKKALEGIRATLLHEALFSFYKSFYNFLALRRMQNGGIEHWINITLYYSKLYLAIALNTLCGKQAYPVRSDKEYFNEAIFKTLEPDKYRTLKSQKMASAKGRNDFDFLEQRFLSLATYTITLDINFENTKASVTFTSKGNNAKGSSHDQIWSVYALHDMDALGLTSMLSEENFRKIIDERNLENYSFDGYRQLDFNIPETSFPGFFERDYLKEQDHLIYDETSGIFFGAWCEIYNIFKEFKVAELPIETSKFKAMISYMLQNSEAKSKLIKLCEEGFPVENEYCNELNNFLS